jgi:hypothetical protein
MLENNKLDSSSKYGEKLEIKGSRCFSMGHKISENRLEYVNNIQTSFSVLKNLYIPDGCFDLSSIKIVKCPWSSFKLKDDLVHGVNASNKTEIESECLSKIKCKFCNKKMLIQFMRNHLSHLRHKKIL